MSIISLLYDGYEIIQDTILADATFESQADGHPGVCRFRVKDAGQIDAEQYGFDSPRFPAGDGGVSTLGVFHAGLTIELRIDSQLVWAGVTTTVSREYAFDAENTSSPGTHQRFWVIEGVDWNVLFTKRMVWNVASPTDPIPTFTGTENDGDVVKQIMSQYMDLADDGISDLGVMNVGPLSPYGEPFNAATPGDPWGQVMDRITAAAGAIYYIDPDKVLQYADVEIPTAPYRLSDQPSSLDNAIGVRDFQILSSGTELANDALVWGAGQGTSEMVFSRVEDAASQNEYGRFQWADFRSDMWLQDTVDRRAASYIYGSPTSQRGHNEPQIAVEATVFTPGFRVGQVVEVYSAVFELDATLNLPYEAMGGTVSPNLANFMEAIAHFESHENYTSQNHRSFAYGKYQIMPGNWRTWGPLALGLPMSSGVAHGSIPPSSWYPEPTPSNQETVAAWRMQKLYDNKGDWRRVAAAWRSGTGVANRQPAQWSRGTITYVNNICGRLGFAPITNATVLPERLDIDEPEEADDAILQVIPGQLIIPIRKMRITFPTPTDAMYRLYMSHRPDVPFFMVDPYPTPPGTPPGWPPIDDQWITEVFPAPVRSPGFAPPVDEENPVINLIMQDHILSISKNEDGEHVGGGGCWSSVGIKNGFLANIPWTEATCGGIGPGAYHKYEHTENWHEMIDPGTLREWIVSNGYPYEVVIGTKNVSGYVPGITIRIAYGDPAPGRFGTGDHIATLVNPSPHHADDAPATRNVDFGSVVIPAAKFDSDQSMWLVTSPAWRCEEGGYYCDPVYNNGPAACIAIGPRCTGEGNSGVVSLTGFGVNSTRALYTAPTGGDPDSGVAWFDSDGSTTYYRTQYPYVPGSLSVVWQGSLAAHTETDPPNGIFALPAEIYGAEEFITVRYLRAGVETTPPPPGEWPPGGQPPPDPNDPTLPSDPEPGDDPADPGTPTGNAVEAVVRMAFDYIGTPYKLGAEQTNLVDCSGLIHRIFTDTGYGSLVGYTRKLAAGYTRYFANKGRFTRDLSRARRGDLISWWNGTRVTHIGIYVGNGYCISALIPPYGVRRHRTLGIPTPFYGVSLVDYPADTRNGGDPAVGDDDDPEDSPPAGEEPPPQTQQTVPYRPAAQRQFGWGTVYDGANCNMACAAMALDRHTLGEHTATQGNPLNTPPNQRLYSGSTNMQGTGHEDTATAWSNGWNETYVNPGPMTWSTFVSNVQSGRGAIVFGRYDQMADSYRKSLTFDGPHAIYINEMLGDGSFRGHDPLVGYSIVYPYTVLQTYALSYYGNGYISAGFTKVTPNI
jgi:cell wall-associated NlpC family hydrolase